MAPVHSAGGVGEPPPPERESVTPWRSWATAPVAKARLSTIVICMASVFNLYTPML